MSFQSAALSMFMRLAKRKLSDGSVDPLAIRELVDKASKKLPSVPSFVRYNEGKVGGVPAIWADTIASNQKQVLLYLHGGGYIFCSAKTTHRDLIWRLSAASGCRVLGIDYRLAPENPYPAALNDALAAYEHLLDMGFDPSNIAIGGDSAGGGLAFGTLLRIRDEGLPLPACAIGLSPWADLSISGNSVVTNAKKEVLLPPEGLRAGAEYYLNGQDPRIPYCSPIFGDLRGLPPALVQVGSQEVLLDDSKRLVGRLKQAGVEAELEVWPKMPHVWQTFAMIMPEAREAITHLGQFIKHQLNPHGTQEEKVS